MQVDNICRDYNDINDNTYMDCNDIMCNIYMGCNDIMNNIYMDCSDIMCNNDVVNDNVKDCYYDMVNDVGYNVYEDYDMVSTFYEDCMFSLG